MESELLAPVKQKLWGRLAVANFFLGGAGTGGYLVAVSLSGFATTPLVRLASALGACLVLGGFLAVAAEAGRPFRGLRVIRMLATSWMSREALAGGAFIALAALDALRPWAGWRLAAAPAALFFVLAQGWVLTRCRGIAAWNAPILPAVFLGSALVSGAAVLGLVAPFAAPEADRLALETAGFIVVSGLLWVAYSIWPGDRAFRQAAATLGEDSVVLGIFIVGHALPLFLLVVALRAPAFAAAAGVLAGVGVLIGQFQAKTWLILRAGDLRPVTLPGINLGASPSNVTRERSEHSSAGPRPLWSGNRREP